MYDRHTVEDARRSQPHYDKFLDDLKGKLPEGDTLEMPRNAVILNAFYMQVLGLELLDRYENRDSCITDWIARDESKDARIANARLSNEPICQHCNKDGLRIKDKSLIHRERNGNHNDPELVLFTLHCPYCDKNSAYWEDGVAWKIRPTLCPKCQAEMVSKTSRAKKALTFTYTCPSCQHTYKDKMDLSVKKETPDPDFEKDRTYYCLHDEKFRHHLSEIRRGFTEMAELGKKWKEKEDNKHIYDAVKEMKKPKIAELTPLLSPVLEKAGYIEFHLDKPEMGRDVYVGFSCLDNKSDRDDYDSRKTLKKLVDSALIDTNWRLMSDGISYRLGYLNGRVKAYEGEEALKNLVIKSGKLKPKQVSSLATPKSDNRTLKLPDGSEVIL
jgi:Zn-finger nucleic acid-binding protein